MQTKSVLMIFGKGYLKNDYKCNYIETKMMLPLNRTMFFCLNKPYYFLFYVFYNS